MIVNEYRRIKLTVVDCSEVRREGHLHPDSSYVLDNLCMEGKYSKKVDILNGRFN